MFGQAIYRAYRLHPVAAKNTRFVAATDRIDQVCFFPNILLPFSSFAGGVESTYSQFSNKLFDYFKISVWIMNKAL